MNTKNFETKHKDVMPIINEAWNMIDSADDVTLESWYEAVDHIIDNVSNRLEKLGYSEGDSQPGAVAEDISSFDSAKILLNEIRISCNVFKNADIPIPEHLWDAQRHCANLVSSIEKYLGAIFRHNDVAFSPFANFYKNNYWRTKC
jgi:hypothetical protein